jgi:DNA-directed RNA polymerase specialized sigma24 family protein
MFQRSTGAADTAFLRRLASMLSRVERLAVTLRYSEELTVAEIAAVMELAPPEVQQHLDSALHRIREAVSGSATPVARSA